MESLKIDLEKFRGKYKGNMKYAMEANNVIDEPFFDIPLDQVIFLSIFYKNMKIEYHSCFYFDALSLYTMIT